jgi:hypothetical protein
MLEQCFWQNLNNYFGTKQNQTFRKVVFTYNLWLISTAVIVSSWKAIYPYSDCTERLNSPGVIVVP